MRILPGLLILLCGAASALEPFAPPVDHLIKEAQHVAAARFQPLLINGKDAPKDRFKAVVGLGGCTATKVGPRHFVLAAHCFFGGPGEFRAPSQVSLRTVQTENPRRMTLKTRAVHLHPTWLAGCKVYHCDGSLTGTDKDVPGKVDLALVAVEDLTPEIPEAALDFSPVQAGETVGIAGLGCTEGINRGRSPGLRFAVTRAIPAEALKHAGSLYAGVWDIAAKSYWVSPGKAAEQNAASLCPGDSGGPAFRGDGDSRVIGISSDYTFDGPYEQWGAIARTNLHTRLDDQSLHGVGAWLRERLK